MRLLGLLAALLSSGQALRMPQLVPQRHTACRSRCDAPMLLESQLKDSIQETVASAPVVIYSKSWCPYCAQSKALFDSMSQPYTAIELDEREDGDAIQATLLQITGQRTVPNVFVAGQHIGGNDDTQQAAQSGKLAALLQSPPAGTEVTGRVTPTSSATAAQLKFVADNKMITETEATIRKAAGVGLGLVTAVQYAGGGMAYTGLSAGIFGALSVYRSGASYQ